MISRAVFGLATLTGLALGALLVSWVGYMLPELALLVSGLLLTFLKNWSSEFYLLFQGESASELISFISWVLCKVLKVAISGVYCV